LNYPEKFSKIDYLKYGNPCQTEIYALLKREGIMDLLSEFQALLVGTYPIGINIENSDLDILCCWDNKEQYIKTMHELFGRKPDYMLQIKDINGEPSVIARFRIDGYAFEVFGQNIPTKQQDAFIHLLAEALILDQQDERFRQEVISLKKKGIKTEPAFAQLLELSGNPYEALKQLWIKNREQH
jgi:hypothetical protein